MVCKELDVTSTHELSHTHPVCDRSAVAPAGKHWEYGNLRRGGLNCIILWNTFGKMEIQPVSLPLPDLLCSTGGIAAGSWLSLVFHCLFCIFVHVFVFVSELMHLRFAMQHQTEGLQFHLFVIISTLDLGAKISLLGPRAPVAMMRHTWLQWRVRCRHPVEWDQIVSDHDQDD